MTRHRIKKPYNFTLNSKPPHNSSAHIQSAYLQYISTQNNIFNNTFASIKNKTIHNLSSIALNTEQITVLGLGHKFIPNKPHNITDIIKELTTTTLILKRKLSLGMFFKTNCYTPNTIPQNLTSQQFNAPYQNHDYLINNYTNKIISNMKTLLHNTHVLGPTNNDIIMQQTLSSLQNNKKIIIKPADKNLGLTILDTIEYKNMCLKHLNDTTTYQLIADYSPDTGYTKLKNILLKYNLLYLSKKKQFTTN